MYIFHDKSKKWMSEWGPTVGIHVDIFMLNDLINEETWLLEGVQIGAREIVDVRQCFNNVSYIYALGNDQGKCEMTLNFLICTSRKNCKRVAFDAVKQGFNNYIAKRISTDKGMYPTTISIGNFSVKGWVTGINIGQVDEDRGMSHGAVSCLIQLNTLTLENG